MDITFKTGKLAKLFNSERALYREFGKENGRVLMRRLLMLMAAPTLAEVSYLKPERRHALTGNRKGQFAVDVKLPDRLPFRPNHDPLPRMEDGGIELTKVTAITVLGVEDYH